MGTIKLLGMSYPLLAVHNMVDLLKYWHMTYDALVRRPQDHPPTRQQRNKGAEENTRHRNFIEGDHTVATPSSSYSDCHSPKCLQ